MKRRRRYGEKYFGIPYPEAFKRKVLDAFPDDEEIRAAVEGGWESLGRWFDQTRPSISVQRILEYLSWGEAGISRLREQCEKALQRYEKLKKLDNEWQRIIFLDDQSCKPWGEE